MGRCVLCHTPLRVQPWWRRWLYGPDLLCPASRAQECRARFAARMRTGGLDE